MPERTIQFLPECHADTALLRYFIPNHRHSIHTTGSPEVARTMLSSKANDYLLVGLVDNDDDLYTRCKGFFKSFEPISQENRVTLRSDLSRQQHIIIIDKAIESFLIWNAEQVIIDISEYGFDISTVKRFGKQLKTPIIETDSKYTQLLTDLHAQQAPGFITLERILNDLIQP